MKNIRFWSMVGSIAVLAVTVVALGTLSLRQRAQLVELAARVHASSVAPAVETTTSPDSARSPTIPRRSWTYEPGVVYLEGSVERPGRYEMPLHSGITAGRLVAAAGRATGAVRVTVRPARDSTARIDEWIAGGNEATTWDGAECMVFVHDPASGTPPAGPALRPDDTIWVAPL